MIAFFLICTWNSNKTNIRWFDLLTTELTREIDNLDFCPDQFEVINDDLIQYSNLGRVGNLVYIENRFKSFDFGLNAKLSPKPVQTEYEFGDSKYSITSTALKIFTRQIATLSISLARLRSNNDLNKLKVISESETFKKILPLCQKVYNTDDEQIQANLISIDQLFLKTNSKNKI